MNKCICNDKDKDKDKSHSKEYNIEEQVNEFLGSLPCQSNMPFPPIKVERQNLKYANLLQDAYAKSGSSELQAITQYIYHNLTIDEEEIKQALLCIALVEMGHLDTLGELIRKLGGKPAYENSNYNFFNGGELGYGDLENRGGSRSETYRDCKKDDLCYKLMLDLSGEKGAIDFYNILKEQIEDRYIKDILDKIISDEKVHVKIFRHLISEYCKRHMS